MGKTGFADPFPRAGVGGWGECRRAVVSSGKLDTAHWKKVERFLEEVLSNFSSWQMRLRSSGFGENVEERGALQAPPAVGSLQQLQQPWHAQVTENSS